MFTITITEHAEPNTLKSEEIERFRATVDMLDVPALIRLVTAKPRKRRSDAGQTRAQESGAK